MGKIIFILGGARSGKSRYAVKVAKGIGERVAFIATCEPKDYEMKKRIRLHKASRPKSWKSLDAHNLELSLLKEACAKFNVIVIDCLTLLVSNLILSGFKEKVIEKKIKSALQILSKSPVNCIIVSNEVGLGIVPDNKMARNFRDIAGRVNQIVADKADTVFFMVSGIPLKIKDKEVIKGE